MYAELQEAIKFFIEEHEGFFGAVYLEDQPATPDQFQKRLNEVGWGILLGKFVVRKEGAFYKCLTPVMVDENKQVNRTATGRNEAPAETTMYLEAILANQSMGDGWTPLKLHADYKQLFPEDGKSPWAFVIETKNVPILRRNLYDEENDTIVTHGGDEIVFQMPIGAT